MNPHLHSPAPEWMNAAGWTAGALAIGTSLVVGAVGGGGSLGGSIVAGLLNPFGWMSLGLGIYWLNRIRRARSDIELPPHDPVPLRPIPPETPRAQQQELSISQLAKPSHAPTRSLSSQSSNQPTYHNRRLAFWLLTAVNLASCLITIVALLSIWDSRRPNQTVATHEDSQVSGTGDTETLDTLPADDLDDIQRLERLELIKKQAADSKQQAAELRQQNVALSSQVDRLERELAASRINAEELKAKLGETHFVLRATMSRQSPWDDLKQGVTQDAVERLLGKPHDVNAAGGEIYWYYSDRRTTGPYVMFYSPDERPLKLLEWRTPPR